MHELCYFEYELVFFGIFYVFIPEITQFAHKGLNCILRCVITFEKSQRWSYQAFAEKLNEFVAVREMTGSTGKED